MVTVTTDGSFQDISYSQSISDLPQITFGASTVLHHRGAADDFELSNFREIVKNLILHAVGEVSVIFVGTDVIEGKDRNAFFGWLAGR